MTDKERIRNLEEKIQRQRADLARMYRNENEYIDRLKEEVRKACALKEMWLSRYKAEREKNRQATIT